MLNRPVISEITQFYWAKGRLSFNQYFPKFGNSGKWFRNFPATFSEISETFEFSEVRTIQPKILELPGAILNEKKTCGKNFLKIGGNAVPFATASCWKFKPVVLVEWKVPQVCCQIEASIYDSTDLFRKWKGNFWSDLTNRSKRTTSWSWSILTSKFPNGPKRSMYFSAEISEILAGIESTPCYNVTTFPSQN